MFSSPDRLSRALPWALFFATAHLLSAAIYEFPLPTTNLNSAGGSDRTNASVIQGSFAGPVPFIVGDDFVASNSTDSVITSLTVWAIANSPTSGTIDTLDQELSTVTLYLGQTPDGGYTWTQTGVYTLTNSQLAVAPRAYYTGTTDYQSLNGSSYYPIYALTFSGLDWYIPAGQISYFAVGSVPIGDSTFALSVSLDPDTSTYDPFWFLVGSPYTPTYGDYSDSIDNFTGQTVVNVSMDGSSVPEPATLGLLGLGIAGLVLKLRRRK